MLSFARDSRQRHPPPPHSVVVKQALTKLSQSTGKVKAGQLWQKSKPELEKQLNELKTELGQLRIQKIVSSGTKLSKMYVEIPDTAREPR
jgi:ribosomal protein L29